MTTQEQKLEHVREALERFRAARAETKAERPDEDTPHDKRVRALEALSLARQQFERVVATEALPTQDVMACEAVARLCRQAEDDLVEVL
jgi:hypothetical protein